jgi:membrane associated rhomboid family serine protease
VLLLPIGIDDARVSRVPWISIALLALSAVAFLGTWVFAPGQRELEAAWAETRSYWAEHPDLDVPPALEERFGAGVSALRPRGAAADRQAPGPAARTAEQEQLDGLCLRVLELSDRQPLRRFGLVPARGALQPGWITHLFLHAGWMHLLGNMLVFFLVVAPFLEDVWGRPLFLAFYLSGGLFAALCQVLPDASSQRPIVGASGAIMACVGAFTVRFATRRVRVFYWFLLVLRGTFLVPAWIWGLFGLGLDLLGLRLGGVQSDVAYAAHVGGFIFGFGVALALRLTQAERKLPLGADAGSWSLHPGVEKAMAAEEAARMGGHAMELPEEQPAPPKRPLTNSGWGARPFRDPALQPVNAMVCRLGGIASDAIVLVAPDGRRARLHLARVRAVAVGQVQRFAADGDERAGILVTDLVVRAAPGGVDRVVRLPSHRLDLRIHFPQLPPPEAYRSLLALLLAGSNAAALPSREAVLGKPYAGFEDLAGFEAACYGS